MYSKKASIYSVYIHLQPTAPPQPLVYLQKKQFKQRQGDDENLICKEKQFNP
jgi:hypothetical protein